MANRFITGVGRQEERRLQQRLLQRMEGALEKPMREEIRNSMARIGRSYGGSQAITREINAHAKRVRGELESAYRRAFTVFGDRIIEAAGKSWAQLERKDEDYASAMRRWIEQNVGAKVTEIAGTTRDQSQRVIRDAIAEATEQGLGQDGIGDLVQDRMRERGSILSRHRARVIARTETHTASQAANSEAAAATGLQLRKEWIAAGGGDTRDDHSSADGQTVAMNDPFDVGGERLMYPGDPSGSAENVINCRCAVGYIPVE